MESVNSEGSESIASVMESKEKNVFCFLMQENPQKTDNCFNTRHEPKHYTGAKSQQKALEKCVKKSVDTVDILETYNF